MISYDVTGVKGWHRTLPRLVKGEVYVVRFYTFQSMLETVAVLEFVHWPRGRPTSRSRFVAGAMGE